jgi:beta-galactosidase
VTAAGGWSNYYAKPATALLPEVSSAHATDWVSVTWPSAQTFGILQAYFGIQDGRYTLPSALSVTYWDGTAWQPVRDAQITWATADRTATTITFSQVNTTYVRMEMTSSARATTHGFIQLAELDVIGIAINNGR